MEATRKVILIMTDTQRADMLNCYRNTGLKTPNLDRLAEQGIRFDKAYTCQPVCGPARSALFTGTYPHTNGSWGNDMPIGHNIPTVGRRLTDAGLHCAYIGKWHLDGTDYFGDGRCPEGWDPDYWYDMRSYLEELSPEDRRRSRKISTCHDPDLTEDFTYGHRCSNRAVDFLEKYSREDFFLVVSYDEPHGPFLCPEPYCSMYADYRFPVSKNCFDTLENKPEHQRIWAGSREERRPEEFEISHQYYFGCHTFVDYQIGRVLDAVDRLAPDALVIFTSDHGDFLGSHYLTGKGPAMYDEITRIPFIVRWPGHAPAATVCSHPVSHIDIVPTILDAAGLPAVPFLEGRSMVPTFIEPSRRPNDAVFMEFGRYEVDHDGFGGFQCIRCVHDGRYKLVVNLLSSDELYDLETDPEETANLIASPQHSALRDRLHDRLLRWMGETRDPFRGYYWECRPWRTGKSPRWEGPGMTRQRDDDGYLPKMLDYDTGIEMAEAVRMKNLQAPSQK